MDEELCCPVCKQLFTSPVLLPCYHALCLTCALQLQQHIISTPQQLVVNSGTDSAASSSSGDYQESDKLSILSESDSGVICCTSSRPNSYVGSITSGVISLVCPQCSKVVYFDEGGAYNLPRYRVMQTIIARYGPERTHDCQMCETQPSREAISYCEQCDILYCENCRDTYHPARGPLVKHTLTDPKVRTKDCANNTKCPQHTDEFQNMFCVVCKVVLCSICVVADTRHQTHDVQTLNIICKAQKTELSQNLQQLSERAKSTTEFIQRLRTMSDQVNENCREFESMVSAQCDALIAAIYNRRTQLLDCIRQDKELRIRVLKEQVATCTGKLQQTTALLQFCIEALKEMDNSAFLQVGNMLINRVETTDASWNRDWITHPRVSPQFDLTLDDRPVVKAIEQLNFLQMKAPGPPVIVPDDCSAENNSVTVAWQSEHSTSNHIQGYILELDDGHNGEFREVYCGTETICTVDGLHFNCMYNARVRAFNDCGEGEYSELVGLQTAEVARFTFDPILSGPGLHYSSDGLEVNGTEGWEYNVALGTVGFSRGVHYWEFTVKKFVADTDPAFGVARIDVDRSKMLGKDDKGWAMYIDGQRSWFQHAGTHKERIDGGIQVGSTVGVLLDLDKHTLMFYVNDEPQGICPFTDLYGVFYPAVSLNRGVSISLHSALEPPSDTD